MPEILRLSLLGPFQAELGGLPVQFDTRKAGALIAYLAVGGQPVSRSSLAALFWPDYDTERAYHNLRRVLWSCNKALGKGWLAASAEIIALENENGVQLDTQVFQDHLAGCQMHGHTPLEVCHECLAPLEAAADLYRGEFMAGFTLADSPEFDDWQFFQREHWKNEISQVLSRLTSGWEGQGENERAIQFARRWLALDPLNEIAHSELMRLYAQSGQRTAALRQYEVLSQVLEKELGVRPSPETLDLFNRIRSGANGLPPLRITPVEVTQTELGAGQAQEPIHKAVEPASFPETSSRLPVALTPFIGRKKELEEISRLVDDPACRLLTILGPGGIGKTRLALQVAYQKEHSYNQGSYFVPLASLASAAHIIPAIAGALQFSFYDPERNLRQQLFGFLRQKQVLLVMDNFEHLIGEDSISMLLDLMSAAPQVKLVVTSRIRLNLSGEHLYPIAGLSTPEKGKTWSNLEDLVEFSALQLFIQSARRARPDFELGEDNLAAVASICQTVQGMPLGIELAAAWLELLSPAEIVQEIRKSLDFLEASQRDIPERQRSLRAIFNATWSMLSPQEQVAFKSLSIFQGGFTRQAAEEVAGASLKDLAALVNKALLYRLSNERYVIHELLRQYAAAALKEDFIQWQAIHERHSRYYHRLLEVFGKEIHGPGYLLARKSLEAEIDNLRLAWQWAIDHSQYEWIEASLYGFSSFLISRALYSELISSLWDCAHTLEAKEASRKDRLLYAKIITMIARHTYDVLTDYAPQLLKNSLAIVQELHAEQEMGIWFPILAGEYGWRVSPQESIQLLLNNLSWLQPKVDDLELTLVLQALSDCYRKVGEFDLAKSRALEAIEISQRIGDQVNQAENYRNLADLLFQERAYEQAKVVVQKRLEIYEEIGDQANALFTLDQVGRLELSLGEFKQAEGVFQKAVERSRKYGLRDVDAAFLSWQSIASQRAGELAQARHLRQESLAISRQMNEQTDIIWGLYELGEIERIAGNLEAADRAYQEGLMLYQDVKMTSVLAFYYKALGDLALARRRYSEAWQHFEESRTYALRDYNFWCAAYATDGLGRTALGLGDLQAARDLLKEALEKALEVGDRTLVLAPIANLGYLFTALEDYERAAGLSAFVIYHPAAWYETRERAKALLAQLATRLPADRLALAQERGQRAELEAVVQLLIADPNLQEED